MSAPRVRLGSVLFPTGSKGCHTADTLSLSNDCMNEQKDHVLCTYALYLALKGRFDFLYFTNGKNEPQKGEVYI